jgi:5'-nucleotidase
MHPVKVLVCAAAFLLLACGGSRPSTFELTLAHLNDTHSHLESVPVDLTLGGVKTTVPMGGMARIKTTLDQMRAEDPALLLLHGGDAVQGTLYFTLFSGAVEYDFLNRLGVDALTFGNHEFDRGLKPIPGWIGQSRFPWLSANIDFSAEPSLAPLVSPFRVKLVNGERVAILGVTTETTPQTTLDVGRAVFKDAVASVRQEVADLGAMGIDKIVLLSHLGYAQDLALAAQISGVDIIVGGHSHTLLGEGSALATLGLTPEGLTPTVVLAPDGTRVLVTQAWQWGQVVGRLQVQFDPAGQVLSWRANPILPVGDTFTRSGVMVLPGTEPYRELVQTLTQSGLARIVAEDPGLSAQLAPYTEQVAAFRSVPVATAAEALPRGLNSGPGPLAADSMLAAVPHAQVAILNQGGVRKDLAAGTISVGDVLEVMPFANSLVLVDLTGVELRTALEEGIDFLLTKYPQQVPPLMPYVGGVSFSVQPAAAKGLRVASLAIKDASGAYQPVRSDATYRVVVNAFVAGGGDGFATLRNAPGFRSDTGILDSDALRDHLKALGTVRNPTEPRITILSSAIGMGLLPLP